MSFPKIDYSKSAVNNAGIILISESSEIQIEKALKVLNNWRACHGYPVNTFQSTLRKRLKLLNLKNSIVAQRLKRRPTIIAKLKRIKGMRLSRMQDIGGLRAVVNNLKEVSTLETSYLNDKNFQHSLIRKDDYIANPKPDGYRSIHLIYRYKNKRISFYNGLSIEFQIRTKLQHIWATAVETMGTYLGQSLKAGEGERKWKDFFAITSSAFAYIEGTRPVPQYSNFNKIQTFQAVSHFEKDIDALNIMAGYKFALNIITEKRGKSFYYHLIILDSINKKVDIKSYAKNDIKLASHDYSEAEAKVSKGEKIEPVLVSAGDIKTLKTAYPNFFLDVDDFIQSVIHIKRMATNITS
ncbi:MAG: RelA/SpoT domain-containing protein [Patescibacteria group bacterium]